jgi:hypothetical protein
MFGLRTKDTPAFWVPDFIPGFTTEDSNWSYIGSFIAAAGGDNSLTNAALDIVGEVLISRSLVNADPDNQEAYIHNCTRVGNTVTATHGLTSGTVATLVVVLAR